MGSVPSFTHLRESKGRRSYSVRQLAKDLGITQSTYWLWLHNEKGYPSPKSFDTKGAFEQICTIMEIPRGQLAWALDQSRRRYTSDELERDPSLTDAFANFIEYMEKMLPKRHVPLAPLITAAKNMYFGSKNGEEIEKRKHDPDQAPESESDV